MIITVGVLSLSSAATRLAAYLPQHCQQHAPPTGYTPYRSAHVMTIGESMLPEFDTEMATTRRLIERVPTDKGDWKPHPKSFAIGHLTQLVARMPGWITMALKKSVLDLAEFTGYSFETTETLLA